MFRVFEGQRIDDKGIIQVKEGKKNMSFNDNDIQAVIEFPEGGSCISVHMMMFLVPFTVIEVAAWLNEDTDDTLEYFVGIKYNK